MGEVRNLKATEGARIYAQQQQVLAEAIGGNLLINTPSAATLTTGSGGSLVSTAYFAYCYSFAVLNLANAGAGGFPSTADIAAESVSSPLSSTARVDGANRKITVTISTSADPLVNARVIYRTPDGSVAASYFQKIVSNNTTGSYVDTGVDTPNTSIPATTANTSGLKFFGSGQSLTRPINPLSNNVFSSLSPASTSTLLPDSNCWLSVTSIITNSVAGQDIKAVIDGVSKTFWSASAGVQVCKFAYPLLCEGITTTTTASISGYQLPKTDNVWPKSYSVTSAGVTPCSLSGEGVYERFHMMFANRASSTATTAVYLTRSGIDVHLFQAGQFKDSGDPALQMPITLVAGDSLKLISGSTATVEVFGIKYSIM